ncbi:MAG: proprotein convertase P-domain-containing protein [Lewinellaceae bacterium]|nr:proprotein convertase P-domain-containing protein [Saprospiraceae bacterium]MCB9333623.1 proprotein convertase P-domain-containing protein [Lewinellaceae bacterium]
MRFCLLLCCILLGNLAFTQNAPSYFKPVSEGEIQLPETAVRKLVPQKYLSFQLDYPGIKAALQTAPQEFTEAARQHSCTIALPTADGTMEDFAVWEIAMLEPALAAELPFIRTFAGESLRDKRKKVRLSYTLKGFQAMIMNPNLGVEYLDRYAEGQTKYYIVYDRKDSPLEERPQVPTAWITPDTKATDPTAIKQDQLVQARGDQADPVKLRIYKYVVSNTGEYGLDNGPTKNDVMSAKTEHTNRVSGILERDVSLRLQLIQATLLVTYTDPASAPFSGTLVPGWAGQNQDILDAAGIPRAAYDVGHVYARYMGGGAVGIAGGLSCLGSKAGGCTGGGGAYGDGFISTIGQEVGHQFTGGHTWNRCGGGAGRANGSAFEPGSGSTIMSYAGACGSDNVQGYSDLYYHAGSIQEMQTWLFVNDGSSCGTIVETDNHTPVVTLDYQDGFFIPWGTPFELDGSATDSDGDPLMYSWEEIDIGPEVPLTQPTANSPIFRSWPADTVTNRYFPRLSRILSNTFDVTEQMPGPWTRDLTFRLSARDNRTGGVGWADVAFKAWGQAGPFKVQAPNTTGITWNTGEYTEVRWDVAKTNEAPVNCRFVNIRLSTDGGLTYPVTLAEHVSNDGSHFVLAPAISTTQARIRIDAENSVFFDVSDRNFTIQAPTQPSLTLSLNNDSGILCLPAEHAVEILTAGVLGFSNPVSLEIVGALPPNVTANFSSTTLQPGESATLKLDFSQVTVAQEFTITVQAAAAGVTPILRDIVLTTLRNDFSALALTLPANGATELQLSQTLHWTKAVDALYYDVQFASDPSFAPGTILASTNSTTLDNFTLPILLVKGTPYFWRVRPVNACGAADWTDPFFFSTYAEACTVWEANDLPKSLTSNGTPTIESKITVNAGGAIKSVEVHQLKGYHEFFKDLDVHLISPQGTDLTLWTNKCGNFNGSFNLRLTDAAPGAFPCPPPNTGLAYRPQNALNSAFFGQNSAGVWTLRVRDLNIGGGGNFEIFSLEFCSEVVVNPPYLVNNNMLVLDPGTNKGITPDLLLVEDANNTHSELEYTLLTVPEYGHLSLNGSDPLQPGAKFTQAQLDNGALHFFDYGGSYADNGFRFMVTDGEGGFFGTPKFRIGHMLVGANEPAAAGFDFRLFPNPANESVWLAVDQPMSGDVRVALFNMAGQLMQEALLPSGADRLQLHTAGLPRGMYLVQVQGSVRKLVLK